MIQKDALSSPPKYVISSYVKKELFHTFQEL